MHLILSNLHAHAQYVNSINERPKDSIRSEMKRNERIKSKCAAKKERK